jgi:hypothetical protein
MEEVVSLLAQQGGDRGPEEKEGRKSRQRIAYVSACLLLVWRRS